jgi:prophage regulatory protein
MSVPHSMLRLPQVCKRTGLNVRAVYREVAAGRLAPPVPITERSVAWVDADVDKWIADRIAANRDGVVRRRGSPNPRAKRKSKSGGQS